MAKLNGRTRRRSAFGLALSGAATITFDHRMRPRSLRSSADALAGDWKAVGDDLRRAMTRKPGAL